jgi:hypothetical protein
MHKLLNFRSARKHLQMLEALHADVTTKVAMALTQAEHASSNGSTSTSRSLMADASRLIAQQMRLRATIAAL